MEHQSSTGGLYSDICSHLMSDKGKTKIKAKTCHLKKTLYMNMELLISTIID